MDIDSKIITIPECGCWIWAGYIANNGYGQHTYKGRTYKAHRLVYELLVGPIPDGLQLDHLCRVRCCVNPAHLDPVTQKENVLRGESFSAVNASKTHCCKGHPLTPDNISGNRWRKCKICKSESAKKYSAAHVEHKREKDREWKRKYRSSAKSAAI